MNSNINTPHFSWQGNEDFDKNFPLIVNWSPTKMCNYTCSYCFGQEKLDRRKFSSWEQLENAVENIARLNRPLYRFTFSGGEPTLHPHFIDLLNLLSTKFAHKLGGISIISNGSRNIALYENIVRLSKNVSINFNISLHTEFVQYEHIHEIISMMPPHVSIVLKLMFNPDKFYFVKDLHEKLCILREQHPFFLQIVTLREAPLFEKVDSRYTEEHVTWQKEATKKFAKIDRTSTAKNLYKNTFPMHTVWKQKINNKEKIIPLPESNQRLRLGFAKFTQMYCCFGLATIKIRPDGRCKGALCRLAKNNSLSLFSKNFHFDKNFFQVIKCTLENCGCVSNYSIPKFSNKEEADIFIKKFYEEQSQFTQEYQKQNDISYKHISFPNLQKKIQILKQYFTSKGIR